MSVGAWQKTDSSHGTDGGPKLGERSHATLWYRQLYALSLATRNVAEVFFVLRSREQIAFALNASTILRR